MPFSSIQNGCLQSILLLAVAAGAGAGAGAALGAAAARTRRGGGARLVERLGGLCTRSFAGWVSARLTRFAAAPSIPESFAATLVGRAAAAAADAAPADAGAEEVMPAGATLDPAVACAIGGSTS